MRKTSEPATNILYLIYDGDCILCRNTAKALKIRKAVGRLEIIDARGSHPLVIEASTNRYDLNEGILVKFNNNYYYGIEALHFLALISSPSTIFNKLNSFIFKSKCLSACLYPLFKTLRNMLLFLQRIPAIPQTQQATLIQLIYGKSAEELPEILQKRYGNRPYSKDNFLLQGEMNVTTSKTFRLLSPLFRLTGTLAPHMAEKIPVSVELVSEEKSNIILMHRIFNYQNKTPHHFYSRVKHIKNNMVIELMRFGFACRLIYHLDKNKIIIDYGGYVFCLGKWLIPIPLGFILGKISGFEEAESDERFSMQVKMVHPLFGKIFQYDGQFKIATLPSPRLKSPF